MQNDLAVRPAAGTAVIDLTGPSPVLDLTGAASADRALLAPTTRVAAPAAAPAPVAPARARRHGVTADPRTGRRLLRLVTGLLLAALTVAAVGGAVLVVVWRVAFTPVLSPSMEPAFGAGDLLVTRALDARDVAVGQVLVLPLPDAPGQRFVHRVTAVRWLDGQPVVTTKGDANAQQDPWELRVSSRQVPVVAASVDRLGALGLVTRDRATRLVLLGGVALLAVVGIRRSLV